jgi:hypothetical protein
MYVEVDVRRVREGAQMYASTGVAAYEHARSRKRDTRARGRGHARWRKVRKRAKGVRD